MKKQIGLMIWTVLFVGCLTGMITLSASHTFAQSVFNVESVNVEASPSEYYGRCPGTIKFTGAIKANGKGRVKYTWLRNDGATLPVEYVDFAGAGVRYVSTTWTLGDFSVLPNYHGWQQIQILSPNSLFSNKAEFKLVCTQSAASNENLFDGKVNHGRSLYRSDVIGYSFPFSDFIRRHTFAPEVEDSAGGKY
ncbi:MAG: hypothetical protein LUM44_08060 [Pyrinomonadaceae bacterium]|nr:hypothetical protein [Pyrinomonadaceae bacterium]